MTVYKTFICVNSETTINFNVLNIHHLLMMFIPCCVPCFMFILGRFTTAFTNCNSAVKKRKEM